VRLVEKKDSLNLVMLILKFGDVWIPYSRSLDVGMVLLLKLELPLE